MSIMETLKNIQMFSQLSDAAMEQVFRALKERKLAAGEILFNQGDPGNELIIVKEGKVAIYSPIEGAPGEGQAIRVFEAGGMLGEMALIDKKPRSLSARAEGEATILSLGEVDFQRLWRENDEMAFSIMSGLSDRIRYTTEFLTEVRQWVQRIAEGNYAGNWEQQQKGKVRDNTLETLAAEFAHMAAQVRQREDQLKREVAQLRVEIDEAKRRQEVKEIMSSDYYNDLKAKIKRMRDQNQEQTEE